MTNWFNKLFKKQPTEPVSSVPAKNPTSQVKVSDFPRSQYDAHWETVYQKNGLAIVRIYSNQGKLLTYSTFDKPDIQQKVDTYVRTKMPEYRKK